jgi:ubiquinone/menaquinone biosynthesis C-methylase UbiE
MSDRLQATQQFYGRWAQLYDLVATAPGVTSWRKHVVEMLSLSPGETVVEMGCGTGANFPYLRERVGSTGRVFGIDLVPKMIEQARRRIERRGWKNVYVACGDAVQPPIAQVNAIVSTFLVGMLENPGRAVRTWIEHLEPGGRIAIMNAGRSDRLVALPLNLVFRVFVRLTAPDGRKLARSPTRELEARWENARNAVLEETVDYETGDQGLGFIRLACGRVG